MLFHVLSKWGESKKEEKSTSISGAGKARSASGISFGAKRINGKKLFARFRLNCFVSEDLSMRCRYEAKLDESRVVILPCQGSVRDFVVKNSDELTPKSSTQLKGIYINSHAFKIDFNPLTVDTKYLDRQS